MATIRFKAMAAGVAPVTFVFDPNSTIDTSLVAAASGPTNVLTTVQDGNYTINTASQSAQPPVYLPPTGVVEDTLAALAGGFLLVIAGLIVGRKAYAQQQ